MYQGSDIIDKPIVAADRGKKIGGVKDVLFSASQKKVLGLLVEEGGLLATAKVVPFSQIDSIGSDAVIVKDINAVIPAGERPDMDATMEGENVAKGTRVMTDDGKDVGKIADIFFDETSGTIEGYEVSGGVFADAYSGKSFLPAPESFRIGEDVAFITEETAQRMQERGGVKGLVEDASSRVEAKAGEWKEAANERFSEFKEKAGSALGTADTDQLQTIEQAIGQRVKRAVRAKDMSTIAAHGQIVTDTVIMRAREHNAESELISAVRVSDDMSDEQGANTTTQSAENTLEEGVEKAKDMAQSAWNSIKNTASEFRDKASDVAEDKSIEYAVGKRAGRMILDKQDNVILGEGEVITYAAVDQARGAGVLGVLLSSAESVKNSPSPSPSSEKRERGRSKKDFATRGVIEEPRNADAEI